MELHDLLGLTGVAIGTYCYARLQWRRDFAKEISYSVLNFIASVLIMFSLMHNWNLSSFVNNLFWGVISIYGIYRCMKYMWRSKKNQASTIH